MTKGESTRQRIVERAAVLFNQRGFAGCSMHDVMEAAGIEKGGLYRHFRSKEELAAEAFRYALAASAKIRTEHLEGSASAASRLREIVGNFVAIPSAVAGGCPLMNTAIDSDDGNPALRALALGGVRAWRRRIAAIVREGKRDGEIRTDADPLWLANTIVAALEGALMISRLERTNAALLHAQTSLFLIIDSVCLSPLHARSE